MKINELNQNNIHAASRSAAPQFQPSAGTQAANPVFRPDSLSLGDAAPQFQMYSPPAQSSSAAHGLDWSGFKNQARVSLTDVFSIHTGTVYNDNLGLFDVPLYGESLKSLSDDERRFIADIQVLARFADFITQLDSSDKAALWAFIGSEEKTPNSGQINEVLTKYKAHTNTQSSINEIALNFRRISATGLLSEQIIDILVENAGESMDINEFNSMMNELSNTELFSTEQLALLLKVGDTSFEAEAFKLYGSSPSSDIDSVAYITEVADLEELFLKELDEHDKRLNEQRQEMRPDGLEQKRADTDIEKELF